MIRSGKEQGIVLMHIKIFSPFSLVKVVLLGIRLTSSRQKCFLCTTVKKRLRKS
jgi:hypothetical protein